MLLQKRVSRSHILFPLLTLLVLGAPAPVQGAARSTQITFVNRTRQTLTLAKGHLSHGIWTTKPPARIGPNSKVTWASESKGIATGTEGTATYRVPGTHGTVWVHWDNPFTGSNSYDEQPPYGYYLGNTGGSGNNAHVTWTLEEIVIPPLRKEKITRLAVRVLTANQHLAGTDNKVYFDMGPLGWELPRGKKVRERGSDDTHQLAIPKGVSLSTEDITRLRLHKKGIGGVDGTSDGIDGQWKVAQIHLIVNGKEWVHFKVNQWLRKGHASWVVNLRPHYSREEFFARSLRLVPNEGLKGLDESVAAITTKFAKEQGISGWMATNVPVSFATGRVIRNPGKSTDGLATIDLRVESIEVGNKTFQFDGKHGINSTRYIRVEYKFRPSGSLAKGNPVPGNGQRVRIGGVIKWDTDHEGWWEIHPRSAKDVQVLR
jgi:hypothetical protein